jgi:hypothetical protein
MTKHCRRQNKKHLPCEADRLVKTLPILVKYWVQKQCRID